MTKIRNISEIHPTWGFLEFDVLEKYLLIESMEIHSVSIIRKILVQEKEMFEGRKVSDRIVSIDRYYVRQIVRGMETKSVELRCKGK